MSSNKKIALTFDDGPSIPATDRILTVLEKEKARATFFVVGERVSAHSAQLKRMVQNSFQIGNHTWKHEYISRITKEELQQTIQNTSDAIADACGVTPVIMRPPGGFVDTASASIVGRMGLAAVLWSVDPRDWKTRDTQSTIDYILMHAADGAVILMHDLYEATAAAAEFLIPELKRQGYDLVTVEELAADRGGISPGNVYYDFSK